MALLASTIVGDDIASNTLTRLAARDELLNCLGALSSVICVNGLRNDTPVVVVLVRLVLFQGGQPALFYGAKLQVGPNHL